MMKIIRVRIAALAAVVAVGLALSAIVAGKPKMAAQISPEITTPDTVETRLGTLKFFDGLPDKATVERVYDNLDFMRGVDVFLNTMAAASTLTNIEGWFTMLRLYGALEPWFAKTWKPGEIELVK